MAANRVVTRSTHQHELASRRHLAAVPRLDCAQILAKGQQIKPARHYQAFGKAMQLLTWSKGQQVEAVVAYRRYRARQQPRLGPNVRINKAQPVDVLRHRTGADPTRVRFADPMRRQGRTA